VTLAITGPQQTGEGFDSLVSIENVDGGDGNDQITGNNLANALHGGKGSDQISGGGGADQLSGGAGPDQFIYSQPTDSAAAPPGATPSPTSKAAKGIASIWPRSMRIHSRGAIRLSVSSVPNRSPADPAKHDSPLDCCS
jgi:Ca2+-binding RTX toxin-like protein